MSTETVYTKFEELPPEAKKQAVDFVSFLYDRYVKSTSREKTIKTISESSFVGMWADREEMADSTEWVKNQREKLWSR